MIKVIYRFSFNHNPTADTTLGDGSFVLHQYPHSVTIIQGDSMPRNARKKSSSGVYHVVVRGINKQRVFEDEEDYRVFLDKLRKYKKISGYKIFAYCLMSNHIHLLMKEENESLSTAFRRIGASYVYWYNWKYGRVGHLFQDRYKSEVVENDEYFLTVMRYIHQNPIKAGIVKDIQKYPWSSYPEYSLKKQDLCDTDFPLKLFSIDPKKATELWVEFNQTYNDDKCMEFYDGKRLNDIEAVELIISIAKVSSPADIQSFEIEKRNKAIRIMKEEGLSIRQIERLTGVSFGIIRGI
jgi:putative transposase